MLDTILHLIFPKLCYQNSVSVLFFLCVGMKILKSKNHVKHTLVNV